MAPCRPTDEVVLILPVRPCYFYIKHTRLDCPMTKKQQARTVLRLGPLFFLKGVFHQCGDAGWLCSNQQVISCTHTLPKRTWVFVEGFFPDWLIEPLSVWLVCILTALLPRCTEQVETLTDRCDAYQPMERSWSCSNHCEHKGQFVIDHMTWKWELHCPHVIITLALIYNFFNVINEKKWPLIWW